jgi:hypothetical protein
MAAPQKPPKKPQSGTVLFDKKNRTLTVNGLIINDSDVFDFLAEKPDPATWLVRAVQIGTLGLRTMGAGANLDYVEKRFNTFLQLVEKKFRDESKQIGEKIDDAFDMTKSTSMVARFQAHVDELFDPKRETSVTARLESGLGKIFNERDQDSVLFKLKKQLEDYFGDKTGRVQQILAQTFDPDNKKSALHRLMTELKDYLGDDGVFAQKLQETFDLEDPATPLAQLSQQLEEYFDEKEGKLAQLLDKTFDPDDKTSVMSQFTDLLADNFDVNRGNVKKLLDPNKDDSPIGMLKKALLEHLQRIEAEVIKEAAQEEEREKGTAKGFDFEDFVEGALERLAQPHTDEVHDLSHVTGAKGKKGDFVVNVEGDSSQAILVEAKDAAGYTKKRTLEELQDAMMNRNAKFGIFLFKEDTQIPNEFKPVKIFNDRMILSAEGHGLYLAYALARQFVQNLKRGAGTTLPLEKIQGEFDSLVQQSRAFDQIQTKATQIINGGQYIQTEAAKLRAAIEQGLERIRGLLTA